MNTVVLITPYNTILLARFFFLFNKQINMTDKKQEENKSAVVPDDETLQNEKDPDEKH